MTLIIVREARLRPTKSATMLTTPTRSRSTETIAQASSTTTTLPTLTTTTQQPTHAGRTTGTITTTKTTSRVTAESSGLTTAQTGLTQLTHAPTYTASTTTAPTLTPTTLGFIIPKSGTTRAYPTTTPLVPQPTYSAQLGTTITWGALTKLDWSATTITIPARQLASALSDVKISPVMSGDVFCTTEIVSKTTLYPSGMIVRMDAYPVMSDVFPSGAMDTQWVTIPNTATVTHVCDVYPILSADQSLSGLHTVESPRIGSSSGIFGDFDLNREYAPWYEMLQAGVPPIALQLFAIGAAMKAQFVRLAAARWMAMGYSDVPTVIREYLAPRIENARIRSLLDAVSVLSYSIRNKTYIVTFRAPPVKGYAPGVRIVRSIPTNLSLVSITGSFRDAIWLTLVTTYGWNTGMFVSQAESWAQRWEHYMDRIAAELGAEVAYQTLTQEVDVDYEEIRRTTRTFLRQFIAETPPEIHEYVESGSRALNLESILKAAVGYARAFHRFIAAAPIVFAAISQVARTVGVSRLNRFKAIMDSFRRPVETLNEFLTKGRLFGQKVPEWASGFVEAYAGIHLGLSSAVITESLIQHGVDPSPASWVELMSGVLTRYTTIALSISLASLKACELITGETTNPYHVMYEMTARLMVVPEKVDMISQVIGKMVPKEVEQWMKNIADRTPYFHYLGLMLTLIPLARAGIAWLEKYAEGIKRIVAAGAVGPPTPGSALGSFLLSMRRMAVWMPANVASTLKEYALKLSKDRLTKPPCPQVDPSVLEDEKRWVLFKEWLGKRSE